MEASQRQQQEIGQPQKMSDDDNIGGEVESFPDYERELLEMIEIEKDFEFKNQNHSVTSLPLSQASTTTSIPNNTIYQQLQLPSREENFSASSSWPTNEISRKGGFCPSRTLRIEARGIGLLCLPLPARELKIPIYNADGTLMYVSRRSKRCSGDCVLSSPTIGNLFSTTYFFGPNRNPIIRFLRPNARSSDISSSVGDGNITMSSKWTSRSMTFSMLNQNNTRSQMFEWKYAKSRDPNGNKVNLIVLRRHNSTVKGRTSEPNKILAQLVRSKETRTQGSSSCSAGNGGILLLSYDASQWLDEALIVATCLIMLKREMSLIVEG